MVLGRRQIFCVRDCSVDMVPQTVDSGLVASALEVADGRRQPGRFASVEQQRWVMLVFLIVLLVLWLVLTIVGFAIKGLIWLAIIGIVLFLGTSAIGYVRRKAAKS
jgi:hypothetical protein